MVQTVDQDLSEPTQELAFRGTTKLFKVAMGGKHRFLNQV